MRILFIVQGEGRGHLTQAVALEQMLRSAGHECLGAWVGVAEGRPVPQFFRAQFPAPIHAIESPPLVYSTKTNALLTLKTTWRGLRHWRKYGHSLRQLRDAINEHRPDVVVNFFDLLGGLTYFFHKPAAPMVCIGHQCLTYHPNFTWPAGKWFERLSFKFLVKMNCWGATELLGLSFDKQADQPQHRLRVVPPLLRQEVLNRQPTAGNYVLAYTTQPGLISEVRRAHAEHPHVPIKYFHGKAAGAEVKIDETLTECAIDGQRFLNAMQQCRAVVSTAGFESVAEAMYFGKPVLMMPQPNHYEQMGNALDGQRAGAGIAADAFDLDALLGFLPTYDDTAPAGTPERGRLPERFRAWQAEGHFRFMAALQRAAAAGRSASGQHTSGTLSMPKTT